MAKKWNVSERSVRNYCAHGRVDGAFLVGKTWSIPESAEKPERLNKHTDAPKTLLEVLKAEKAAKLHGGIYHKIQIELTYNSNHIEGSRLTHDQTRYIFETNTLGVTDEVSGKKELLSVKIDPEVVDPDDVEMLEDLVTAAVNEALGKATKAMEDSMGAITGGLNLPGMPGMF